MSSALQGAQGAKKDELLRFRQPHVMEILDSTVSPAAVK